MNVCIFAKKLKLMIRYVRNDDASEIAEIYNYYVRETTISFETVPLSAEDMARRISSIADEFPYLVFEHDGVIQGFCYAHRWKERAAYCHTLETTVYLAPACKRKGIGSMLMSRLIDECRKIGVKSLIACITAGNSASIMMHRSLGFREASYFASVGCKFGEWLDVTDYQLIL